MGVDYYKVLQVDRRANNDDIKAKFNKILEAYHVLSDPQKRAVYDQYGEAGLKGNVPPPNAAAGPSPSRFNQRSADDIFTEFFGVSEASYFSTGDGPSSFPFKPQSENDIFAEFLGGSTLFGGGSRGARKLAPIEKKLPCSLDDLYKGTTKKMKISREIVDVTGKKKHMEEILTIVVKPGWKTGTKITFAEKGNEHPGVIPSDLVFIIDEKPHLVFTREGDDLIVTKQISLADVLTGYTVNLTTLDGRTLTIPVTNVIHPEYEEVVPKEGMPLQKDQTKKGNLRIKFTIKFPARFTAEQKAGFKKLVG